MPTSGESTPCCGSQAAADKNVRAPLNTYELGRGAGDRLRIDRSRLLDGDGGRISRAAYAIYGSFAMHADLHLINPALVRLARNGEVLTRGSHVGFKARISER